MISVGVGSTAVIALWVPALLLAALAFWLLDKVGRSNPPEDDDEV